MLWNCWLEFNIKIKDLPKGARLNLQVKSNITFKVEVVVSQRVNCVQWSLHEGSDLCSLPCRWCVGSNHRLQTLREAPTRITQQQEEAWTVRFPPMNLQSMLTVSMLRLISVCLTIIQERPRVVSCTTSTCSWSTIARCSARASSSSTCGKCLRRARRAAAASTQTSSHQPPTLIRSLPWPSPFYWTSTATLWCCPRAGTWAGTWAGTRELWARNLKEENEVSERCQTI